MGKEARFLFFAHGGSYNHGCEALIRSTAAIFKSEFGETDITVASTRPEQDIEYDIPYVDRYIQQQPFRRYSLDWFVDYLARKGFDNVLPQIHPRYYDTIKYGAKVDVAISIGGDNYCYNDLDWLYLIDREIKRRNGTLVLWGCSIEPDVIDVEMETDLRRFDLIIARETITYNALMERGIEKNLHLYPDPAFILEKVELPLPEGWQKDNMIGLNISPLIMDYEKSSGIAFNSTCGLIKHILQATDYSIALIPHVLWDFSNDIGPLTRIYERFEDTKRVLLFGENYNAPQLKGLISHCRMFVGARTHATIAAYSTCVPTLVVGYSVKARGIARDIFGSEENMVISVQSLEHANDLVDAFKYIQENEETLRKHLQEFMPSYIEKAWLASEEVKKLIEK